jgi:hypothetical protein
MKSKRNFGCECACGPDKGSVCGKQRLIRPYGPSSREGGAKAESLVTASALRPPCESRIGSTTLAYYRRQQTGHQALWPLRVISVGSMSAACPLWSIATKTLRRDERRKGPLSDIAPSRVPMQTNICRMASAMLALRVMRPHLSKTRFKPLPIF